MWTLSLGGSCGDVAVLALSLPDFGGLITGAGGRYGGEPVTDSSPAGGGVAAQHRQVLTVMGIVLIFRTIIAKGIGVAIATVGLSLAVFSRVTVLHSERG